MKEKTKIHERCNDIINRSIDLTDESIKDIEKENETSTGDDLSINNYRISMQKKQADILRKVKKRINED